MANKYDVNSMKSCAASIESQLKAYTQALAALDNLVSGLNTQAWDDETNRRFVQKYNQTARQTALEVEKTISNTAKLMNQSAGRVSNAIDNGNSLLSS